MKKYIEMRNLSQTPEPGLEVDDSPTGEDRRIFVVQKHAASRLHYDFRLQSEGMLKSWAVPKGPSLNPRERRLAIKVEDHPMGYAKFEGVIPEGEYGAGTVIIWDRGTYEHHPEGPGSSVAQDLRQGKLIFELHGEKLRGGWALIAIDDKKENWLLIKRNDDFARRDLPVVQERPRSVHSGRSLDEIEAEENQK